MDVAAVVVTWNGERWIEECLASLARQQPRPKLVVVDNASSDRTPDIVDAFRATTPAASMAVRVVRVGTNEGFTAGANRGLGAVAELFGDVELVLLLNQDTFLEAGCLAALVEAAAQNPSAGALGAKTLYPNTGTIQHAGGYLTHPRLVGLHYGHHQPEAPDACNELREVDYVTGAAMMLRRAAIREVGRFNEVFSPGYYEDVELCERLRSGGWSVLFVPEARAQHPESSSFSDRDVRLRLAQRNRYLFALPRLADKAFRREFVAAELDFMARDAHFDEVRAIRSASVELLSKLPRLTSMRLGVSAPPSGLVEAARREIVLLAEAGGGVLSARLRGGRLTAPEAL